MFNGIVTAWSRCNFYAAFTIFTQHSYYIGKNASLNWAENKTTCGNYVLQKFSDANSLREL
ncbi:MAG: hypothetical protein C0469_10950 [Cyanobacteria bacterium DS2.3.42]|nr:hypothetical protein [Cyanobacteria bacterium DS2.3.42]